MDTVPSVLSFVAAAGKGALNILNEWIDSREIATSWYGKETATFTKPRSFCNKLWRRKFKSPEINSVFTIKKEDWHLAIKESLPVAHTWYHQKENEGGECCWLPLYKACRKRLPDVLKPVKQYSTYLGIVSGLPAARLDLWGLVVMAYSNGAWSQFTEGSDGGYRVTLLAKNFVLTISQGSIAAPIIGHLEPREYPAADREPLGVDETTNLLDYGHSFSSAEDTTIGWPLYGAPDSEPPRELVNGQWDGRLHQVILDNFRVQALKLKLRDAITTYRKSWVSFLATGERGFEGLGLRDILVDLSQLELHILQAEKQRVIREFLDLGLDSKSTIEEDLIYKQTIHPGEQEFPEKWGKNLRRLGEFVDMQLWRIKLLFYDEVQLVNNQNRADALDMLKEEGELMEAFTLHYNSDPHVEHSKPGLAADNALQKLLQHHHRVMAMARMLYLCEKIDQRLSARNTGWNVLLA